MLAPHKPFSLVSGKRKGKKVLPRTHRLQEINYLPDGMAVALLPQFGIMNVCLLPPH